MKTKLYGKDLFPFIHGVLSCSLNENGDVVFNRFTDLQKNRYQETGALHGVSYVDRANASSGVTLELRTDSSFLALHPIMSPACRPFASFDFYVDGVLYDHLYLDDLSQVPISFDLPDGIHTVKLCFPWSAIVALKTVVLSDGAFAEPVTNAGRFLAFGDSITQGYITTHPSCSYVNLVSAELGYDSVNQAIGGYWFDYLTLDSALAEYKPDFITVAYGTNDYSLMTSVEEFTENCEKFTKKLVSIFPDTKILGILPIYRGDAKFFARRNIRDIMPEEAYGIIRDIYRQYPNITILEDTYFPHHENFFAPDILHPNDLGFMFYAKAVTKAVREMLAK